MTVNMELLQRVKETLSGQKIVEKEMLGGVFFLLDQEIACGVWGDYLVVNVGEDRMEEILTHPLARVFEAEGGHSLGCVQIVPTGTARAVDLAGWVRTGLETASAKNQGS